MSFVFLFFWNPYNSDVGALNVVPEISGPILISFHSFFFVLLCLSCFHHSIFHLTYPFFCFTYSANWFPLESDILECEVKWALESITMNKASGCNGISVELFQILEDDAVKVLHSICQQIGKTRQWPQDWKRSVFISIPKKGNPKECSN